ncbi:MAG TPA: helix-turn-helix domain-containing protein, partial [Agromyces sp.]
LADYLGINVQAIYDLRCDRRGPAGIRVGRELRYRATDVRHWLEALQEIRPEAGPLSPAARGGEQ